MSAEQVFRGWMADMDTITHDVYELFSMRRTFRDVAEVFQSNARLQEVGGHLWEWLLLNYVANVLMRIRRLVDNQRQTLCLKQLMIAIIRQPEVITRGRRYAIHGQIGSEHLRRMLDREFTTTWVRESDPEHPEEDRVDATIVRADLAALENALEGVTQLANRTIAHRTRTAPGQVTYAELDDAFEAIEAVLTKYYALVIGNSLVSAEPTPQFDTHEVFTFPWIERAGESARLA